MPHHLYLGSYSDQELEWWADRIREWLDADRDVWAFFNNDGAGNAVRNARRLRQVLSDGADGILTDDVDVLSVPDWPVLSRLPQRAPARVLDGGVVVDSLLSPGARVSGRVERSVLGPGVVVEAGALVADSVVFTDAVIRAGAELHWTVLDARSVVEQGTRVSAPDADALDDPDAVTLIGCDSRVGPGVTLAPGARLEPGTVHG